MEPGMVDISDGYIKLFRRLIHSRVFQNEGLLKVFIWCLLKANHKEKWVSIKSGRSIKEVKVLPGQFVFGRNVAAKEMQMSPSTAWKRIHKLKKLKILNIKSDSNCSIITIIKWGDYQGEVKEGNSKGDRQVTGKEQASDTTKNDKNDKNVTNKVTNSGTVYPDWLDLELWAEFKRMRTRIKKPLTPYAEKLAITQLKKQMEKGYAQADIINRTVLNSWQSFYEPKNGRKPNRQVCPQGKYDE
jgi:hypothetical protein